MQTPSGCGYTPSPPGDVWHASAEFVQKALGQKRYLTACWSAVTPTKARPLVSSPAADGSVHGELAAMASVLRRQSQISA
jgi:hypothetical protein